jgi:hypothetical protein
MRGNTKEKSMLTDQQLEEKLEASPAPRVTVDYINSRITERKYQRLSDTLTHCTIVLDNGFQVTGESACVNPANYNQDIGERIAHDNAFQKLWPLFGFRLAEKNLAEKDKAEALY